MYAFLWWDLRNGSDTWRAGWWMFTKGMKCTDIWLVQRRVFTACSEIFGESYRRAERGAEYSENWQHTVLISGRTDAIFVVHTWQNSKICIKVYMAFVDLKKSYDRVPLKVSWTQIFGSGWLNIVRMSVIKAIWGYIQMVKVNALNGRESKAFSIRVGVLQGSVFCPLLFMIVLKSFYTEFFVMEQLYADDLVKLCH